MHNFWKRAGLAAGLLLAMMIAWVLAAQAAPTQITWFGHAAFRVISPNGTVFLLDPWLHNPIAKAALGTKDPFSLVEKADFIAITHGHFDHTGDTPELAAKTGAKIISSSDLGRALVNHGGVPATAVTAVAQIGGESTLANGEVMVTLVPAMHGSDFAYKTADGKAESVYGGLAVGIVLVIKGGPTIYDTGDTAYFSDMKLIGEMYHPDVILVNIGGHFGMEPHMAAKAVETVGAKLAIPMHWKTQPALNQDEGPWVKEVENMGVKAVVMKPLQTITFEGKMMQ